MIMQLSDNRYFGVLFLIPILLAFFLGGVYLHIVVSIMGLRALYEFYTVVAKKSTKPLDMVGYAFGILLFSLLYTAPSDLKTMAILTILITVTALAISVFHREYNFIDASITVAGFIYTCVFFALILLIYAMPNGNWYIFTIFTTSWISDTCAYYTGRKLGKHKLIPEVSPKKTVEGAIGGLIGGAVFTLILGLSLYNTIPGIMHPIHFLIMGLIGSVLSQVGDLIASAIKRDCGVKDYPKLIPGHGGVLDRFDSVLFSAVSIFIYLTVFLGY
jgi:phosphatidate cytidylyltransferase